MYDQYVKDYVNGNPRWDFVERIPEIQNVFRIAKTEDSYVPFVEMIGYGMGTKGNLSVQQNIACMQHADLPGLVNHMFHISIGTFKFRCKNSFNPIWWLGNILTFPSIILDYLGVENVAVKKSANVIAWCATSIPFLIKIFKWIETLI